MKTTRKTASLLLVAASLAMGASLRADEGPCAIISAGGETDTATGSLQNVGQVAIGVAANNQVTLHAGGIHCLAMNGGASPACPCGDIDGSGGAVNLADFSTFANCFGLSQPTEDCDAAAFACADLDGSGMVNLTDFATFAVVYGTTSSEFVPNCGE
jgi:hypothetical protein